MIKVSVIALMFLVGTMAAIAHAVPSTASTGYVEVPGGKLYFEQCGAGSSVVLLHDGLLHSVVWDDMWPALCAQYHVVRFDRRGYGKSDSGQCAVLAR